MNKFEATIETTENRWMRAWVERDRKALFAMTGKNFRCIVAAERAVLLDRASLVDADPSVWSCTGFRFGAVHCRRHGKAAIFSALVDLEMKLEGQDWSGKFWLSDLWRKSRLKRRWELVDRSLSRPDEGKEIAPAIRSLQLWR